MNACDKGMFPGKVCKEIHWQSGFPGKCFPGNKWKFPSDTLKFFEKYHCTDFVSLVQIQEKSWLGKQLNLRTV